jgi:hypothetical protein
MKTEQLFLLIAAAGSAATGIDIIIIENWHMDFIDLEMFALSVCFLVLGVLIKLYGHNNN